jgi:gamma-butyrobetaine dioxygenase
MSAIEALTELFANEGADEYLGEPVTQAQHMYQSGLLAEEAGAPDALVAAALLHDVGHFHGALSGHDLMAGTDNHHSDAGADWLAQWFGPEVTEPVRLHVAAKRYLCTIEPDYFDQLSQASRYTLSVQGGPMSPERAAQFAANPYAADAIAIRRFDDGAKDPQLSAPGIEHFTALLERLVRQT